ncbi:hypothetical protein DAEQUDRAFT_423556 [Daedalea quercina L-15889]|uniref:Uncharacterized protein n=1 Tax=Daedalea quercina L-15889 TaxID=1314783 RepID=A0A165TMJ0_9APHY|nr:hypothetical protein DAEQUDRAFT_423556 [Daedalea quercina L-15889]
MHQGTDRNHKAGGAAARGEGDREPEDDHSVHRPPERGPHGPSSDDGVGRRSRARSCARLPHLNTTSMCPSGCARGPDGHVDRWGKCRGIGPRTRGGLEGI